MNFMKRVNGSWVDTPNYIHKTDTDTFTTLPAVVYPNAATATVGLKGQAMQSGTPTPDSPIMPQGTGERTGNLWSLYPNQTYRGVTFEFTNSTIKMNNTCTQEGNISDTINLKAGTYTIAANANINISQNTHILQIYKANVVSETISLSDMISGKATFTIAEDTTDILIRIHVMNGVDYSSLEIQPMFNSGSTALPFEPFGVKIPISSAGQTNNIYLGEVESTRRIKKYEFTGQEDWTYSASGNKKRVYVTGFDRAQLGTSSLCSHFVNVDFVSYPDSGKFAVNASSTTQTMIFGVTDMAITSATDWTTYLAAQYAAGTPVCVWYVLATEETATVNEPLMKIDGYADEVNGVSIPTTDGANTLSVDTTVQPSEVSVNYRGWHMGAVHERVSGEWD